MQVKKTSTLQYRANRQLVQANRQAAKDGQVQSNKELAQAASKISVTKKPEVKPGHVSFTERIPTSPTPEEQAAMVFSVSYLEQQQQNGDSVSCYRSTGAVPIPTRRCSTIVNGTPKLPKPRKTSVPELQLRSAELALMNWSLEEAPIFEAGLGLAVRINAVTDDDGYVTCPTVHDAPEVSKAPPKKLVKNDCTKHSKCHCAIFSKNVAGFFDVAN